MTTNLVAQVRAWFTEQAIDVVTTCAETLVAGYKLSYWAGYTRISEDKLYHRFQVQGKQGKRGANSADEDYTDALECILDTLTLWEQGASQGWQPIETALPNCRYLVGVAGSQVKDVAILQNVRRLTVTKWCYFNPSSRRAKVLPYAPTHCYSASVLPAPPTEEGETL